MSIREKVYRKEGKRAKSRKRKRGSYVRKKIRMDARESNIERKTLKSIREN